MEYDYSYFRKRIKEGRIKKKYSQEALAKKIGVTQSTVGHIESGYSEISLRKYLLICEVLDIKPFEDELALEVKKNSINIEKVQKEVEEIKSDLGSIKKGVEAIELFIRRQ